MKKNIISTAIAIVILTIITIFVINYIQYIIVALLGFVTFSIFYKIISDLYRSEVLGEDVDLECGYEEVNE